jgi:hypothetical protein
LVYPPTLFDLSQFLPLLSGPRFAYEQRVFFVDRYCDRLFRRWA